MRWLRTELRRLHEDHRRFAKAGALLLAFTVAAKVAGAAKEVALAWRFGRGAAVDAYSLALTLATWVPLVVASATAILLVPTLVNAGANTQQSDRRFLQEVSGAAWAGGASLSIATWVAAPWLVAAFSGALPFPTQELTVSMLRAFAPLALPAVVAGVAATQLQANHDHRYALADGFPAIVVAAFLIVWPVPSSVPLIVGTLAGFVLRAWWLRRRAAAFVSSCGLRLGFGSARWRALWPTVLIVAAGQLALNLPVPIDQWFAASLGGGAVATLAYVNRIIALGVALGGTVVSRATLPIFAEGVARGEEKQVTRHALRWASLTLVLGAVGTSAVALLAAPVVGLVFERGAFSPDDTQAVATALQWGVWQAPPLLAALVLVSLLAAHQRYKLIAAVAAANIVVKLSGNALLTGPLGLNGILLSSVLMGVASVVFSWIAAQSLVGRPRGR